MSGENFTLSAKRYTNLLKESEENIDKTSCHSGKTGSHFYDHNTSIMTCLKHRMRNIYNKGWIRVLLPCQHCLGYAEPIS